jgi:hypothetical protein
LLIDIPGISSEVARLMARIHDACGDLLFRLLTAAFEIRIARYVPAYRPGLDIPPPSRHNQSRFHWLVATLQGSRRDAGDSLKIGA